MPWTKNEYPTSWKHIDENVREKAIDIGNALLKEGYEEGRAIPIALEQAKRFVERRDSGNAKGTYEARPASGGGWELRKNGAARASFTARTKDALLERAKPFAAEREAALEIYRADGTLERTLYHS